MSSISDRFGGLSPLQRAYLAIEELQSKLEASERLRTEPVAIIGIGCRFPGGADSPSAFWRLLRDGFDAIVEVPKDRWDIDAYYDPDPAKPGKMCTRWGGFLEGVDRFDAQFFNISPREAALMDPQQRLLLEVSWEALEDAGQTAARIGGSRTGVFIGIYNTDYAQFQQHDEAYAAIGNSLGIAVGRVSYTFDLQGPSMLVDTLCSSSLVSVALACQSLRRRECNMALAGGVNLVLSPVSTIMSSRLQALAPDGRCKTFDARANGYVRSEGCGVIVLKRLSDALADGDPIHALVRGTAVNQDGRSTALTMPNVLAQQAVIRQALADGGVSPEQVAYVEAHGTGTSLGDPIEIEALRSVYGRPRPDAGTCAIASIKTNLGHAEAASGIAGLIKAVLALEHEAIPPHLHLRDLNPRIDLTGTPFVIPTELRPFPAGKEGRFAAVSSFGLSGTNAHVVLQQAPLQEHAPGSQSRESGRALLLPLSARSPEALRALAEAMHARLDDAAVGDDADDANVRLHDLCFTAAERRTHHDVRVAVAGASAAELQDRLRDFLVRGGATSVRRRTKLAFVFSGHGGQYPAMGRELLQQEPVFRKAVEACDKALRSDVEWSLLELLEKDVGAWQQRIDQVQPAIFALQVALAELWRSWGIRPDAVAGHSMGEVAAAHVCGALSLEHAARVICRRSALLERMRGRGATLMIDLPEHEVRTAIGSGDALSIAASNGPRTTVVAGDAGAVAELMSRLERQNVFCRRVQVDVAAHTPQMQQLAPEILAGLEGITAQEGEGRFYSSVHGRLFQGNQCGPGYWAENLQRPVQFWKTLKALVEDGHGLFVEVGPHQVLAASITDGLKALEAEGAVRPSLRKGEPERRVMLESLGALYEHGHSVNWQALYPGGRHVRLPAYPWQRERFWVDAAAGNYRWLPPAPGRLAAQFHPLLGDHRELSTEPGTFLWEFEPAVQSWPYLADHRVEGMIVVPAAVFVELAAAAAKAVFADGGAIEQLRLHQMLVLREGGRSAVQLIVKRKNSTKATFQFASRDSGAGGGWTLHASGFLASGQDEDVHPLRPRDEIQERCRDRVPGSAYYQELAAAGLEYGPAFQGVAEIWRRDGEALARLEAPDAAGGGDAASYPLHPVLLDSAFQVFAGAMPRRLADEGALYLPVGAASIRHFSPPPDAGDRRPRVQDLWVHAQLGAAADDVPAGAGRIEGDLCVFDAEGRVIADIRGFAAQRLALANAPSDEISGWLFTTVWRRQDGPQTIGADRVAGASLIIGRSAAACDRLRHALSAHGEQAFSGPPESLADLLGEARRAGQPPRRVVYLAEHAPEPASPAEHAAACCADALRVTQTLAQAGFRDAPRLWLVTRGVHAIAGTEGGGGLPEASLWGLGATIALEHPEFACSRIDLGPEPREDDAVMLAAELCADDKQVKEDRIALRPEGRYVARLVRRPGAEFEERNAALEPAGDRPFTLVIDTPGILDHLKLRQTSRRPPAAGEIEIQVQAAGLNFLDVMSAMGLRPGDDGTPVVLGGECAGVVSAAGEGVTGFRPGDPVVAIAASSFSRYVTTPAAFAVAKPAHLSFEEAATIPVAFLTAYYALHEIGRIQAGERILIHSASGGTGLAAVQLAQRAGAEIFATAGSAEKREFLRFLGIPHVMDSRSLDFADEVMSITDGRGVDLVLNSLTGEAIDRSLSVLAPDGRFLEIGKKDIYEDYRVGLLPFRGGLSYFAVDLAGLAVRRPKVVADLLREIMSRFAADRLRPLPYRRYPIRDAADAFRTMAQARHTGKLVLAMDEAAVTPIAPEPIEEVAIRGDGTYLITGGLGGVGFAIAEWLVEQGARHLVLMGRRPPGETAAVKLELLRKAGAAVEVLPVDVSQHEALAGALAGIGADRPPLRGIVHAAAVLEDATLMRLNESSFKAVFAPKIAGAWNLHQLTEHLALDFFVLFSSAASVLGSPGQGNYAAANAFLDALAHYRRQRRLTALSINWGPWAEVGLAAAQENRGQRLAAMGIAGIPPSQGAAAFGRLLADRAPQVAVMAFRLRQWRQLAPAAAALPLFAELVEDTGAKEKHAAAAAKTRASLLAAEPGKRRALLEEHLTEQISQVLRTPAARITRDTPFNTLGMDSLMGLELRNRLESSLGLSLQATMVWSHPTIASLVPHLAAKVGVALEDEAASPPPADSPIDELSEIDAAALLAEKLASLDDEYRS